MTITLMVFDLWSIESDSMSVLYVKDQVQQLNLNFSKYPNIKKVGRFEGVINQSDLSLKFIKNNKNYTLEFRCNYETLLCPSVHY